MCFCLSSCYLISLFFRPHACGTFKFCHDFPCACKVSCCSTALPCPPLMTADCFHLCHCLYQLLLYTPCEIAIILVTAFKAFCLQSWLCTWPAFFASWPRPLPAPRLFCYSNLILGLNPRLMCLDLVFYRTRNFYCMHFTSPPKPSGAQRNMLGNCEISL